MAAFFAQSEYQDREIKNRNLVKDSGLTTGRPMGLEPTTNGTTNHYSNQLS